MAAGFSAVMNRCMCIEMMDCCGLIAAFSVVVVVVANGNCGCGCGRPKKTKKNNSFQGNKHV